MLKQVRLLALILAGIGVSYSQSTTLASPATGPDVAHQGYTDSPAGLEAFLSDALSASNAGATESVLSSGQSLILPNADAWFVSEFGDEKCKETSLAADDCMGPRLAAAYATYSSSIPASFEMTLRDLKAENLTNFEAVNYTENCPAPMRIAPSLQLQGGLYTTPFLSPLSSLVQRKEPVYVVWAYGPDKETTVGFFVYADGAFRYIGMPHPITPEEYLQLRDSGTTSVVKAPPHYLSEDQLQVDDAIIDPAVVAKTVILSVTLDREGKPLAVTYVRGPEPLSEDALREVRKWRFNPPGFGPNGMHPNILCVNWNAPL